MKTMARLIENTLNYFVHPKVPGVCNALGESDRMIEFLHRKEENDIKSIIEFINDIGDSVIKVETIKNLFPIRKFLVLLESKIEANKDPIFFVKSMAALLDEMGNIVEDLEQIIHECNGQIGEIAQIFFQITNRELANKLKGKECYKYSVYNFGFLEKIQYVVEIEYGKENSKQLSFVELLEIKDRSLLLIHSVSTETGNEDRSDRELLSLVKIIDIIEEIIELLNSLYNLGYPTIFYKNLILEEGDSKSILEFHSELQKLEESWNSSLIQAYERYYPLTFLTGRQIASYYTHYMEA